MPKSPTIQALEKLLQDNINMMVAFLHQGDTESYETCWGAFYGMRIAYRLACEVEGVEPLSIVDFMDRKACA